MLRLRPRAWSLPILIDICFVRKKISSCKPQLSCLAFCRIKKLFIAACAIPYLFCSYPHICRYISHWRSTKEHPPNFRSLFTSSTFLAAFVFPFCYTDGRLDFPCCPAHVVRLRSICRTGIEKSQRLSVYLPLFKRPWR